MQRRIALRVSGSKLFSPPHGVWNSASAAFSGRQHTHSIAAAAASCSAGGATAPSSPDCSDVDESRDDDSEDDELELV